MNTHTRLLTIAAICAALSLSSFAAADSLAARDPAGEAVTRELAWDGSETLTVGVPAHVRYVQTDGPGKVRVTGPRRSVDEFSVAGGVLSDKRWRTGKPIEVVVYAPRITRFSLKGNDRLVVEGFDQPELWIETVGRAEAKVSGNAGRVTLQLQGFGWVDLSELTAREADVTLTGSRHALVGASERVRVSGNGSVVLVKKPKSLDLALGESGRVFTLGEAATAHNP
jgi:Putative auto-transporter adhesin, head GIN domain